MLRLGRSLGELLFVQGQATHFVQDLNQPLHAAWGETRAEHNEVEAQDALPILAERPCIPRLHARQELLLLRIWDRPEFLAACTGTLFDRQIRRVTEIA